MRFYTIILIAIAAATTGCSRGPAKISVTNDSSVTVSNVMVCGQHFSQSIGSMTPNMSASFALTSRSETNVWLYFETDGKEVDSRGKKRPNYFKASSRHPLSLTIGADLSVTSSSGINSH
jgi:hypothetical protein